MKKKYIPLIIIFIILFLGVFYYYFHPLFNKSYKQLFIHKITDISYARSYYSVLSSFFALLTGLTGLSLGYIYFTKRIKIEDERLNFNKKLRLIEFLKDEIDKFDDLVDSLICFKFTNEIELNDNRDKIEKSYDKIRLILENNEKFLKLKQEEVIEIVRIYSFVDKCDLIKRTKFKDISKRKLKAQRSDFSIIINNARIVCYNNLFADQDNLKL